MKKIKVIIILIVAINSQMIFSNENTQKIINNELILKEIKETISNLKINLNYSTLEVKPRTFIEAKLDEFNQQVAYTSALDPIDQLKKIPNDLNSKNLSRKLEDNFTKLEKLVQNDQLLSSSNEWLVYQNQIREYLRLRKLTLFRASRYSLKDGTYEIKFNNLKNFINKNIRSVISSDTFSVKNPGLELALQQLESINSRLIPSEVKTVEASNYSKIYSFVFLLIGLASFISAYIYYKKSIRTVKEIPIETEIKPLETVAEPIEVKNLNEVFYYTAWIKKFEESLNSLNNEIYKEEYQKNIVLNAISILGEAKVGLQLANNQHDYESNLSKLKECSTTIEDFFSEKNDESQKHFNNIVLLALKLSNAIETNKTIINETISGEENNFSQQDTNSCMVNAA